MQHMARCATPLSGWPVDDVADDGMAGMGKGRTDLVQETGLEGDLYKGRLVERLERPPGELRAANAPVHARVLDFHDAHTGGPVARNHESTLERSRTHEFTPHEGAVALLHAVRGEGSPQPLEGGFFRREKNSPGGLHIEAVDHAAAQPALPDAGDLGMTRRHRREE